MAEQNINLSDDEDKNNKLKCLEEQQKIIDRAPFIKMKIDDTSCLDDIDKRKICEKCCKSRKFFCYTCYSPLIDEKYIPKIKLPIKIDVIKHKQEIDGKSTAIHATIIASEDVQIFTYPNIPDFPDKETTILIFPDKTSMNVEDLFIKKKNVNGKTVVETIKNQFPITRAVFIDSTWHQTKSIYKDSRLKDLPCVILKSRISQFWRHQKKSPRWYLATIEAIHQFLVELHTNAFGIVDDYHMKNISITKDIKSIVTLDDLKTPYCGQYDNLLYFFKYMYEKIHEIYDHDRLWAYKRPLL